MYYSAICLVPVSPGAIIPWPLFGMSGHSSSIYFIIARAMRGGGPGEFRRKSVVATFSHPGLT
jgi:hypothetical protein